MKKIRAFWGQAATSLNFYLKHKAQNVWPVFPQEFWVEKHPEQGFFLDFISSFSAEGTNPPSLQERLLLEQNTPISG